MAERVVVVRKTRVRFPPSTLFKMEKEMIFGYGSLISKKSRDKTNPSKEVIPVRIEGLKRSWNINVNNKKTVALGATKKASYLCNGVLFEISKDELLKFDGREKSVGYKRVRLKKNSIKSTINKELPKGNVWAYITKKPEKTKFPIIQSYLDVILTGCLEISKEFAREFLLNTFNWTRIENDRKNPRYPRYMKKILKQKEIDNLLKEFNKLK